MSAIKAGDLVMVMRGHCTQAVAGMPKTVLAVERIEIRGHCLQCGETVSGGLMAELQHDGYVGWLPVAWLKKIDPLSELESIDIIRELELENAA